MMSLRKVYNYQPILTHNLLKLSVPTLVRVVTSLSSTGTIVIRVAFYGTKAVGKLVIALLSC